VNDNASRDPGLLARLNRTGAAGERVAAAGAPAALDATEILASVGEALYRWDIESDVLLWSANAGDVLLVRAPETIALGRAYAQLLEPDNVQARFDAVVKSEQRDEGRGVGYRRCRTNAPRDCWNRGAATTSKALLSNRAAVAYRFGAGDVIRVVPRTRCSAQRCTADPGSFQTQRSKSQRL
jgi:hypothetical protein